MVPPEFNSFFVTCAQAAGTLIGLLFVAVTIAPHPSAMEDNRSEREAVAGSAFTALVNAFFISIGAQIPHTNIGILVVLFGLLGLITTAQLVHALFNAELKWRRLARGLVLTAITGAVYLVESWQGAQLLLHPSNVGPFYTLDGLLMGVFGIGLVRAWELLGVRRYGILGWLNPLRDTSASIQPPNSPDPGGGGHDKTPAG